MTNAFRAFLVPKLCLGTHLWAQLCCARSGMGSEKETAQRSFPARSGAQPPCEAELRAQARSQAQLANEGRNESAVGRNVDEGEAEWRANQSRENLRRPKWPPYNASFHSCIIPPKGALLGGCGCFRRRWGRGG